MKKNSPPINLTIFNIFISIILISTFVAMLLFFVNFLGVGFIMSNGGDIYPHNPRGILTKISEHFSVATDEDGNVVSFSLTDESILPGDYWCILLDDNGDILWSLHKSRKISSMP